MECVVPPCRTRKMEEKAWQIAPPQLENVYNFHDAVLFKTIEFELKYFIRLRAERGELFFLILSDSRRAHKIFYFRVYRIDKFKAIWEHYNAVKVLARHAFKFLTPPIKPRFYRRRVV